MTNDDAKNWVTIKIPEETRDRARDIDAATYGEVMDAGVDAIEDGAPPLSDGADLDEDALARRITDQIGSTVGGPRVDDSEIAALVAQKIDYVQVAEEVSERIVSELEGRR